MQSAQTSTPKTLHVQQRLLGKNAEIACKNREALHARGIFTLNVLSSPGAGKTALFGTLAGTSRARVSASSSAIWLPTTTHAG
ncbi:MAG: hypothetical protein U0744_15865 [Gemmataceae bacterium]